MNNKTCAILVKHSISSVSRSRFEGIDKHRVKAIVYSKINNPNRLECFELGIAQLKDIGLIKGETTTKYGNIYYSLSSRFHVITDDEITNLVNQIDVKKNGDRPTGKNQRVMMIVAILGLIITLIMTLLKIIK